jgi:hypothetical protein
MLGIDALPVSIVSRSGRALGALVLMLGGAGCGSSEPTPSADTTPEIVPTPAVTASSGAPVDSPAELILDDVAWYEVDRVGDLEGNESRTLFFGSLGGTLVGRIPLAAQGPAERREGFEPFSWTDPQADGVFGRRVLVWGREGNATLIEGVDVADASTSQLVQAGGTIHVATADRDLTRVFFITVDEATNQPTGLWVASVGQGIAPTRLTYRFATDSVRSIFTYRLVASPDGSRLAVQAMEGPLTLIDVDTDQSAEVRPGGPVIGFADGYLVAFSARSPSGARSVVAYDPERLEDQTLTSDVVSAQVVPGTDGDYVIAQHNDDTGAMAIEAIMLSSGESRIVHEAAPPDIGQGLARPDLSFLGTDLPPDWTILVDSFFPFVPGFPFDPGQIEKPAPPLSSYPIILNLRTGESDHVGPFTEQAPVP